jgi:uncharacterized membrane protein YtjA (UPF0391 family)
MVRRHERTPTVKNLAGSVSGARLALHPGVGCSGAARYAGELEETEMLMTLAVILLLAWLLGLVGVYTIGGIVHVLLVIAIVLFLVDFISGRRTVV